MIWPGVIVTALLLPAAQRPDTMPGRGAGGHAAAERYEPVFDEFRHMRPRADRGAPVRNLRLRRDALELRLDAGRVYFATPVAGRTVGAVFVGQGSMSFVAPLGIERREMQRVLGDSVVHAPISAAVFVCTDSTLAELERQLSFDTNADLRDAPGALDHALDHLVDDRRLVRPTLMSGLLNGEDNGFFYVHVKRQSGEDLMVVIDPDEDEPVELLRHGKLQGQKTQVVSRFKLADRLNDTTTIQDEHDALKLDGYRIEATIAKGLGFSANATVRLTARREGIHWVRLELFSELAVDSVEQEGTGPLTFARPKQSPELWVRFDPAPREGETRAVRVVYHGDLIGYTSVAEQIMRGAPLRVRDKLPPAIDRWLYVKTPETWFPRDGMRAADVDLTFHTPKRYHFATIGRLVDSRDDGDVQTTHWITVRPADQVCFSLGDFDEFKITDPRIPPVTVHTNSEAHHQIDNLFIALRDQLGVSDAFVNRFLSQPDPQQDVGADVANSLSFFSRVYGPPLFDRYYAAEIPFSYGEAFPGLMYLPVWTFQAMSDSGDEEILRAHEMAHQWWGIGVEPAGYRDWWLAEGFAEFSGLWYMQVILKDNAKFFKHLEHWQREIRARRHDAPPIGIGLRAEQLNRRDYTLTTYQKGAWVLHMLRNLMLDLRGMNEDRFILMMRDFYRQYRGRRASTRDFRRVVEHHLGTDMGWFFDEWVDGTAIPSYVLSWRAEPAQGGHYTLRLRVRQEDVPKDFMMPVPLKIMFADTSMHALVRLGVTGPLTETTLDLPAEPKRLELNPFESVLAQVREESWE
jgi:Peptidase family M1 domain